MPNILRRTAGSALVLLGLLTACKAPVNRQVPSAEGGLSAQDYAKLHAINEAQNAALDRIRQASKSGDGGCGEGAKPESNSVTPTGWSQRAKAVGGARCPVQFMREWNFDAAEQKLRFRHELKVGGENLATYRRAAGVITREGSEHHRSLAGTIHYDRIEIAKIGSVEVEIQTVQRYTRLRGSGEINIKVRQLGWVQVGTVRWRSGRNDKTIYEVNGHPITEDGFNQLFSAYGVPEIMANSRKIR